MRIGKTAEVRQCDYTGCSSCWVQHKGKVYSSSYDWDPAECAALSAEFCSADCHRKAHLGESHKHPWRRRRFRIGHVRRGGRKASVEATLKERTQ